MTQNGSIRKKKIIENEIWEFHLPIGHQGPRLSHFLKIFENEVLVDFFEFGWLDVFDIAYNDSTHCSKPFDNHQLPGWMV